MVRGTTSRFSAKLLQVEGYNAALHEPSALGRVSYRMKSITPE